MPPVFSAVAAPDAIAQLPDRPLRPGHTVADEFLRRGVTTFHQACRWVHALPYGCNSTTEDALILFTEQCGTCFTKHGIIARLAVELDLPVYKHLGFYRLDDEIVIGVEALLRPYELPFIPQIHCFLECDGRRVDLTDGNRTGKNKAIDRYDFVVRATPESTREALQRVYVEHLRRYEAIEPRLAAVPWTTIGELLKACSQLQLSRCHSAA